MDLTPASSSRSASTRRPPTHRPPAGTWTTRILGAAKARRAAPPHAPGLGDRHRRPDHARRVHHDRRRPVRAARLAHATTTGPRPTDVAGRVSVRDLVLHLVGVERYMLGQLGRREPLARTDARPTTSRCCAAPPPTSSPPTTAHIARGLVAGGARPHRRDRASSDPTTPSPTTTFSAACRGCSSSARSSCGPTTTTSAAPSGCPRNLLDDARLVADVLDAARGAPLRHGPGGDDPAGAHRPHRPRPARAAARRSSPPCRPTTQPGPPDLVIETSALDLCRVASNRLPIDDLDGDGRGRPLAARARARRRRRLRDGLKPATAGRTGTSRRTRGASRATREARCGSRSERRPGHRSIRRGHRRAGR